MIKVVVLVVSCLVSLIVLTSTASAQTEKQGIAILKEAREVKERARSRQDLEKALQKYEEALAVFEKARIDEGKSAVLREMGRIYHFLGQYDKALESYKKSLGIEQKLRDVKGEAITLNDIAELYRAKSQYREALECYSKSLSIAQKLSDQRGQSVILHNMGLVYEKWSQYDKALEHYKKSRVISQKLGDLGGEGRSLSAMGQIYAYWGQYDKALEYYEESLTIKQKVGDTQSQDVTLDHIAGIYKHRGQYGKALEYYDKALALAQKLGDLKGVQVVLNNMGVVYDSMGQYTKALEYYEKSLAIARKMGDGHGEATSLLNIGKVYSSWTQYPKALEYYEKSLAMIRELGDVKGEAVTLSSIAGAYVSWGQYPKALEYQENSLAIEKKIGNSQGEAASLNNIANIHCSCGQYLKALEYYENSLAICKRIGHALGEGVVLNNMALIYDSKRQYAKALENFEKSLAIKKRIGVPFDDTEDSIGNVYLSMGDLQKAEIVLKKTNRRVSLGRLALAKADFQEAKVQFEQPVGQWLQNGNVEGLFAAYTGLGLANEGSSHYDQAATYFKAAIAVTEQIRDSLAPLQRANFYEAHVLHIPRIMSYEGLTRVLLQSEKGEQALREAAEATKARVFAESLSAKSQNVFSDVPRDVIDRDTEINNKLAAMLQGLQKAYEKGSKDAIESFEKQVRLLRAERDAHVKKLRSEYPLFAATKYPRAMDLEHAAIKPEEWLVEYQVTQTGIAVFVLHGKKLVKAIFKPVLRKDLEEFVRKFREPLEIVPGRDNLSDKLKAFDFASGKKLTDLLLNDAISDLPQGTPLIIVPDECLAVLPFEMLVLNSGGSIKADGKIPVASDAEFFGDRNPISYYQSVTALTLARTLQKKGKSAERLLVVADPVFQLKDQRAQSAKPTKIAEADKKFYSDLMATMEQTDGGGLRFNRLALTGELAKTLGDEFKGKADSFTGLEASKENLLKKISPQMDRYGTIVFATHGYFGNKIPGIMEPILCLTMVPEGTDGFLRMSEVMGLKLNADIVALTACQTGLGRNIAGEGTMGMGRAFQYAGARSVLMSLWNVEQKASVQLVQSFFRHIKEGKKKLDALRLAREEIRKDGFDHPFFWAPFILVGEVD